MLIVFRNRGKEVGFVLSQSFKIENFANIAYMLYLLPPWLPQSSFLIDFRAVPRRYVDPPVISKPFCTSNSETRCWSLKRSRVVAIFFLMKKYVA